MLQVHELLTKVFFVYSILFIYIWNYFMVEYHTCCWLSECCEDEALDNDAVDQFLAVFEGVCKINISCELHCVYISSKLPHFWITYLLLAVWVWWRWSSRQWGSWSVPCCILKESVRQIFHEIQLTKFRQLVFYANVLI